MSRPPSSPARYHGKNLETTPSTEVHAFLGIPHTPSAGLALLLHNLQRFSLHEGRKKPGAAHSSYDELYTPDDLKISQDVRHTDTDRFYAALQIIAKMHLAGNSQTGVLEIMFGVLNELHAQLEERIPFDDNTARAVAATMEWYKDRLEGKFGAYVGQNAIMLDSKLRKEYGTPALIPRSDTPEPPLSRPSPGVHPQDASHAGQELHHIQGQPFRLGGHTTLAGSHPAAHDGPYNHSRPPSAHTTQPPRGISAQLMPALHPSMPYETPVTLAVDPSGRISVNPAPGAYPMFPLVNAGSYPQNRGPVLMQLRPGQARRAPPMQNQRYAAPSAGQANGLLQSYAQASPEDQARFLQVIEQSGQIKAGPAHTIPTPAATPSPPQIQLPMAALNGFDGGGRSQHGQSGYTPQPRFSPGNPTQHLQVQQASSPSHAMAMNSSQYATSLPYSGGADHSATAGSMTLPQSSGSRPTPAQPPQGKKRVRGAVSDAGAEPPRTRRKYTKAKKAVTPQSMVKALEGLVSLPAELQPGYMSPPHSVDRKGKGKATETVPATGPSDVDLSGTIPEGGQRPYSPDGVGGIPGEDNLSMGFEMPIFAGMSVVLDSSFLCLIVGATRRSGPVCRS